MNWFHSLSWETRTDKINPPKLYSPGGGWGGGGGGGGGVELGGFILSVLVSHDKLCQFIPPPSVSIPFDCRRIHQDVQNIIIIIFVH